MKGRIRLPVIVLCALLLLGPAPAGEPVRAKLEQQTVPEGFHALPFHVGNDDVESAAALTGQGPLAVAARVETTAARNQGIISVASGWQDPQYYATIRSGDVEGDGVNELLGRGVAGMEVWRFNAASEKWEQIASGGPFSDNAGWDLEKYYATIHSADIDDDGVDELLGRGVDGMEAHRFDADTNTWNLVAENGPFSNAEHWDEAKYYHTIHSADIDGDGVDELLGRGAAGMVAYRFDGTESWDPVAGNGPFNVNEAGWDDAQYYATIHSADIDGDGVDELLGRGAAGMVAYRFDGIDSWYPVAENGPFNGGGWGLEKYYATIHSGDIDGDGLVDELLGRGVDGMEAYRFDTNTGSWDPVAGNGPFPNAEGWDNAKHYATIHSADMDGDGVDELLGRRLDGMVACRFNTGSSSWDPLAWGGPFRDAASWADAKYYATIHSADIDGDGVDELLGRYVVGMDAWRFNATSEKWEQVAWHGPFPDNDGWDEAQYYATIHSADIDGDGVEELLGRGASGMVAYRFDGTESWDPLAGNGPFNGAGWDDAKYYATIHSADIDGDGLVDELLGRGASGMVAYRFDGTESWDPVAGNGPFNGAGWDDAQYYATIHSADIDGDGVDELLGRGAAGMVAYRFDGIDSWYPVAENGPFNGGGWGLEKYYATIHSGDIDGDGLVDELLGRGVDGMEAYRYNDDTNTWDPVAENGPFSNADGWDEAQYYHTIHSGDIDGDGVDELLGRGVDGMKAYRYNATTKSWDPDPVAENGPLPNAPGWDLEKYYATIHSADIDGDGLADELLGPARAGMDVWRFADSNDWIWIAKEGPFPVAPRPGNYGGYAWTNDIGYSYPDWMAGIPPERPISALSIPGTHDTMSIHGGPIPYLAECQQMFLENQLQSGIRVLDIRLQCDGDLLALYHGMVNQWADFDEVLRKVVQFLNDHPSETVLMAIAENTGCIGCASCSDSFLGRINHYLSLKYEEDGNPIGPYWDWVWNPTSDNPTLGEVRGKIVILDAFSGAADCGPTPYGFKYADTCQIKQDEYQLFDWHDLKDEKWPAVENQLDAAEAGDLDEVYVNYLSGTEGSSPDIDPVVPYFVASGHISELFNYQYQTDGAHRWTGDESGYEHCGSHYPWPCAACGSGICRVYFTGTNDLTTLYLRNNPPQGQLRRWGIIMADFPGVGLIDAIIGANQPLAVTAVPDTQTCKHGDEISDVTFTATGVATVLMVATTIPDPLPATLTLTGSGCTTSGGPQTCEWVLGGTMEQPAGKYDITVTVTDTHGGTGSAHITIEVPWEIYLPTIFRGY
jgi:hypothetical protein